MKTLAELREIFFAVYEINERIMTGDICSAKTAIASTNLKKILHQSATTLSDAGARNVSLQAYIAAGGGVGIQYSFSADGHEVAGAIVPRRP